MKANTLSNLLIILFSSETYKLKEPVIQEPTNPDTDGTTDDTMGQGYGI